MLALAGGDGACESCLGDLVVAEVTLYLGAHVIAGVVDGDFALGFAVEVDG